MWFQLLALIRFVQIPFLVNVPKRARHPLVSWVSCLISWWVEKHSDIISARVYYTFCCFMVRKHLQPFNCLKVKNIILKVHCIEAACKDAFPIIGQDSGELLNKQDIQTWWVLDHISNRWSNNYPEPDKNRILTRQKYLKSNHRILRGWKFTLRSSELSPSTGLFKT